MESSLPVNLIKVKMTEDKIPAIIVDLDGTLANCDHRLHHLKNKNWGSFYAFAKNDSINVWCKDIVNSIWDKHCWTIIIVTGRPESIRHSTADWLISHRIPGVLYMRSDNDRREDFIVKREIYEKRIKENYDVRFVLEDRKQVVDMWRSLGLVCLQCAPGEF